MINSGKWMERKKEKGGKENAERLLKVGNYWKKKRRHGRQKNKMARCCESKERSEEENEEVKTK